MNRLRKLTAVCTSVLMVGVSVFGMPVQAAEYNDMDEITDTGVDLSVSTELAFTNPSQDLVTSASSYFITGSSDPDLPLYFDGEEITTRGQFGSFGKLVSLQDGANTFTIQQGGESRSVTITRGTSSYVATTTVLTSASPSVNDSVNDGQGYKLTCVAPSGATVTAYVDGQPVQMSQNVASQKGVPSTFSGVYTPPSGFDPNKTTLLGNVVYAMSYDGEITNYESAGRLYLVGENANLVVRVKEAAASVFSSSNTATANFLTTLRRGSTDRVVDETATMFKISMGGWVTKASVDIVAGSPAFTTESYEVDFERDDKGEMFIIRDTANPVFSSYMDNNKVYIKLFNTTGIDEMPVSQSDMFQSASVTEEDGNTIIELYKNSAFSVWGYNVEYTEDKDTVIYCKEPPTLSGDPDQPLKGITIGLDAGHGGADPGALGVRQLSGPVESDMVLATALATKKRLESLGATVILDRDSDVEMTISDRMYNAMDAKADLYISLHMNSIGAGQDGNKPSGIEIYYYEDGAKSFATTLLNNLVSRTGRQSRGVKYTNFKITMVTYAPSVLVELGFLTNPVEYDDMCSQTGIYNTANALADGVLQYLS